MYYNVLPNKLTLTHIQMDLNSSSTSSEQSKNHPPFEKSRGLIAYGFHPVCEPRSERVRSISDESETAVTSLLEKLTGLKTLR